MIEDKKPNSKPSKVGFVVQKSALIVYGFWKGNEFREQGTISSPFVRVFDQQHEANPDNAKIGFVYFKLPHDAGYRVSKIDVEEK